MWGYRPGGKAARLISGEDMGQLFRRLDRPSLHF